jgi:hypothetical protein
MQSPLQRYVGENLKNYLKQLTDGYVRVRAGDKPALVQLAMALKAWANPNSSNQDLLDSNAHSYFQSFKNLMDQPKQIDPAMSETDAQEIQVSLRLLASAQSDELIKQQGLEQDYCHALNRMDVDRWWMTKTDQEKALLEHYYQTLNQAQLDHLNKRMPKAIPAQRDRQLARYYYMCHCQSELDAMCYIADMMFLSSMFNHLLLMPFPYGYGFGYYPSLPLVTGVNCLPSGDCKDGAGVVCAAAATAALVGAGTVGGIYATKKTYNSLRDLVNGDKILRSLFRLSAIGGGGYGGVVSGMIVGAMLGSAIPGFGTLAGSIVGAIFGGSLGMGMGALLAKYIAKGISALVYHDELNPTNPEKYQLTDLQQQHLIERGFDLAVIKQMMLAIRQQKQALGPYASWPFSDERQEKNRLNRLLQAIKQGELYLGETVVIGDKDFNPQAKTSAPRFSTSMLMDGKHLGQGHTTLPSPPMPPPYKAYQTAGTEQDAYQQRLNDPVASKTNPYESYQKPSETMTIGQNPAVIGSYYVPMY